MHPDLALFRRSVSGEGVGLGADSVFTAVANDIGLCSFADFCVGGNEIGESRSDVVACRTHAGEPTAATLGHMERPVRFEHTRWLGDKRTQLVYDLDTWADQEVIDDIVANEVGLCFGPDTLIEARNRGYTLATPGAKRRLRKPRA